MSFLRNDDKKSEQFKAAANAWEGARSAALQAAKGELKTLTDKKADLNLNIYKAKEYQRRLLDPVFFNSELINKKVKPEELKRAGDRLKEISKQAVITLEAEEKKVASRYHAVSRLLKTPEDIQNLNRFIKLYDKTKELDAALLVYTNHLKSAMLKIRGEFPTASLKPANVKDFKNTNKKETLNSDYEFLAQLERQFPNNLDKKREFMEASTKLDHIDSISELVHQINNELDIEKLIKLLTVKDQKHIQDYDEGISEEILTQLSNLKKGAILGGPLLKLIDYMESPVREDDKDAQATPGIVLSRKRSTWPALGAKVADKIDTYTKEVKAILIEAKILEPDSPKRRLDHKR
jgi:hypothetical protein